MVETNSSDEEWSLTLDSSDDDAEQLRTFHRRRSSVMRGFNLTLTTTHETVPKTHGTRGNASMVQHRGTASPRMGRTPTSEKPNCETLSDRDI
jgi:hypothetical protein